MLSANQKGIAKISLERIEAASHNIDPVFLHTPQFKSEGLSDALGMELVLKVETVNPIRCFKGRGADFFVSQFSGRSTKFVCASAGNFGLGLAYAARKRGLQLVVFAAESANTLKLDGIRQLGAEVRLFGRDFDAAREEACAFAEASGAYFVLDGLEPAISEGAGTIAVEICNSAPSFDFAIVPVGDGALISGIGCWMKKHSPDTCLIGVCAAGAPAVAFSWRENSVQSTQRVDTIADGIAVRRPLPEALVILRSTIDDVLLVEDSSLIEAMRLVFRYEGLVVEPAGAAGLATILTYQEQFRGARVVIPLTGGNLTPEQVRQWLF